MLFNSYQFLLGFLPITVLAFFCIAKWSHAAAAAWLALASLFFYGWWNPVYVGLLLSSIVFNFMLGAQIARAAASNRMARARALLTFAIACNLLLLCYYKYANFFVANLSQITGASMSIEDVVLPLGISFFTFTQIAFLVDAYRGIAREYRFVHYVLFVTYFPHLIAGPVLHHKEMMPQFAQPSTYRARWENFAVGGTIFFLGLFKKTVLADGVARYAEQVFAAAARGQALTFVDAWAGVLAYTCQLYFDFSGYSDMAIGLSRLFGVRLPLNFNSPYKAANIIEFWRRWHMTLSRFLRDYLYFSLGGNRKGVARRYANLFATMVLGGLWHGAGWTFVLWGALHGLYLIVNHGWRSFRVTIGWISTRPTRLGTATSCLVTFLAVVVGWVFFRAESVDAALRLLRAMADPTTLRVLNDNWKAVLPSDWQQELLRRGFEFTKPYSASNPTALVHLLALLAIAWFMPNTQEFMRRWRPALNFDRRSAAERADALPLALPLAWSPRLAWAIVIGAIGVWAASFGERVSEFLYFQF